MSISPEVARYATASDDIFYIVGLHIPSSTNHEHDVELESASLLQPSPFGSNIGSTPRNLLA